MNVNLVWITPNAEILLGKIARVSNPANENNREVAGLLKYCYKHQHWSPFEMASMCLEIVTSRAIGRQILRHRSFSFQEFSQRYAKATEWEPVAPRRGGTKNRQSSTDDLSGQDSMWFKYRLEAVQEQAQLLYNDAIKRGIAKESARFCLLESAQTRFYMTGTIRSWMHYVALRVQSDTQLEHRRIAELAHDILIMNIPVLGDLVQDSITTKAKIGTA